MIAYLPKATVQAAIGSVPLAMGLSCGKIVLSVAVLAILITAPLGALGMDATYRKLLQKNGENTIIDSHPVCDQVLDGSNKNIYNIGTIRTAGTLSLWRRT